MPASVHAPALETHLGDQWTLAELLARPGVLESGHFRLLSGAHSEHFLRFSRIASDPTALESLAAALAPTVASWRPDAVLAPSTAGVSLGRELAQQLGLTLNLASVDESGRADEILGGVFLGGRRVLIINDVVTTGEGLEALANVADAAGGTVAGAAWFASRAHVDVASRLGAPTAWLVTAELPTFAPEACPCCVAGLDAVDGLDLN
jgi:orotate phosphoribosyltransferase